MIRPCRGERPGSSSFAERVIAWQRVHGRHDLPWQGSRDPYRIWLSEIMLQQTQVATVLPYYTRFVAEFPSVTSLAAAPLRRVLELWSGLGYYRRAHHLHAAACRVAVRHAGQFPVDSTTLETLPGIGRSTAAAIAAFAGGERCAILDGNVKRLLARHRGIEGWPGEPRVQAQLWRLADASLPFDSDATASVTGVPASSPDVTRSSPDCTVDANAAHLSSTAESGDTEIAAYTQGLMDLGATICTRIRPQCEQCPINDDCVARQHACVDTLPWPRPRRVLPQRAIAVLLLQRNGRILLEQRPPVGIWGGLWSFPEVPLDVDVAAHVASRFDASVGAIDELPPLTQVFTHFALTMHPRRVAITRWPARARMPGVEWFARQAALATALPSPIRRLVEGLREVSRSPGSGDDRLRTLDA